MKTTAFVLFLLFGAVFVGAQEAVDPVVQVESKQAERKKAATPATLAEAHLELERQLPKEELKKIDEMKSEDEMTGYHVELGMSVRNSWGLWGDSSLAKHMRDLGFTHTDDMSGVILKTFWCKRHGKDFGIKDKVEYYKTYWVENKWPDEDTVDPQDKSDVNWIRGYEAEGRLHRMIYIGRSKKSGRLLAFESPTGVYVPDQTLLDLLKRADSGYTQRYRSGESVDPFPELDSKQNAAGAGAKPSTPCEGEVKRKGAGGVKP